MRTRLIPALLAATLALPGTAIAAGGAGHIEDIAFSFEGPFGTFDRLQLQRGFQVYQEICAGCHGMKHLSFRNLGDPGGPEFPEEQVKAIAEQYEVFDRELDDFRTAVPSDRFPANDAVGAPDLSLMAKARAGFHGPNGTGLSQLMNGMGGPEYIYSLLTSYNGSEQDVAGNILYGNDTYPGGYISMAQPLWGDDVEYVSHGEGSYVAPEATMEQQAEDVSAFLMWAAEPKMMERKSAGVRNVIILAILTILLYFTNKKLWAPIKREDA